MPVQVQLPMSRSLWIVPRLRSSEVGAPDAPIYNSMRQKHSIFSVVSTEAPQRRGAGSPVSDHVAVLC